MKKLTPSSNSKVQLTEVFPQGLVITGAGLAPFILFKDKSKKTSFPVWLPYNPYKMKHNISSSEMGAKIFRAPSYLPKDILEFFNCRVSKCIFTDVVSSGVQKAQVTLAPIADDVVCDELKEGQKKMLTMLAYEAFSLAVLEKNAKFFVTEEFLKKTREDEVLDQNHFSQEKAYRKHGQKYLM